MSEQNKIATILQKQWPDASYFSKGGNSYVFKALVNKNEIAIKVFRRFSDPGRYKRFIKELGTIQSLKDINGIVPVLFVNENVPDSPVQLDKITEPSDLAYFAMPYLPSNLLSKLEETIKDNGTIAVQKTLEIAYIIKRLHDTGYAHRDLKPENILVNENDNLFVSDFGLSIDLKDFPDPEDRLSKEGELIGSLSYRASELLRGRLDTFDHRPCDIYSLGRILWALIWGKEPDNLTDLEFERINVQDCGRELNKSRALNDIIKGATAVDPRARLNIDELIESLESWQESSAFGTTRNIIDKLINNPSIQNIYNGRKISEQIIQKHDATKQYLKEELNEMTAQWQDITNKYREKVLSGNLIEISESHHYSSNFHPKMFNIGELDGPEAIRVRFNLGNKESPLLELSLYMKINLNKFDDQKYQIIAAYIPVGSTDSTPKLLSDSSIIQFDYKSEFIRQNLSKILKKNFQLLDNVLKETI